MRRPESHAKGSKRGPSVLFLASSGIALVGITIAVTLWATGILPNMRLGNAYPPNATPVPSVVAQQKTANPNLAPFDAVHRIVTELLAAQDVGMNREKFQVLLQQFSTEIALAAEKARSPAEKKIADAYRQVLDIYKDSAKIWDVKISVPSLELQAKEFAHIGVLKSDEDYIYKSRDFQKACIDGIPLNSVSGSTGLDEIVARHAIPIKKMEWPQIISESSIQLLWEKAGEKIAAMNKL